MSGFLTSESLQTSFDCTTLISCWDYFNGMNRKVAGVAVSELLKNIHSNRGAWGAANIPEKFLCLINSCCGFQPDFLPVWVLLRLSGKVMSPLGTLPNKCPATIKWRQMKRKIMRPARWVGRGKSPTQTRDRLILLCFQDTIEFKLLNCLLFSSADKRRGL